MAAAEMAGPPRTAKEDELVPVKPGRWTMYALISLQGLPHCELAAASAHVPACCPETRGASALLCLTGSLSHDIATRVPAGTIRQGLPAWVPILVRELGLSEADRAMLLAAWFPCVCQWDPLALLRNRTTLT